MSLFGYDFLVSSKQSKSNGLLAFIVPVDCGSDRIVNDFSDVLFLGHFDKLCFFDFAEHGSIVKFLDRVGFNVGVEYREASLAVG